MYRAFYIFLTFKKQWFIGLSNLFPEKNVVTDLCLSLFFCSQLKLSHPEHMLIKRASTAEESFDRAVQTV